jgi:activator of 2-hydroxyglutaryl-CoA dehydratase
VFPRVLKKNVFAGGVARNPCLKSLLSDALGCEVKVPEDPQMVGAFGAALIAGGFTHPLQK